MKAWWVMLLLLPHAAAYPLYAVDAGAALILTPDVDDPRAAAVKDTGQASADAVVWRLHADPALPKALYLNGTLNATAVFDSGSGGASVTVAMTIEVAGQRLASGSARNLTIVRGSQAITWMVPLSTEIPAGPLWWNITARGPLFVGLQLRMQDGETHLDLPDQSRPEPGPVLRSRTLNTGAAHIRETGDGDHTVTTYVWPRNDTSVDVRWNVTVADGHAAVTILDGADAPVFRRSWAGSAQGNQTVTGALGDWRIVVERDGLQGTLDLDAASPTPMDVGPAPRARTTPLPAVVVVAAILLAWRGKPRSGS